MPVNSFDNYPMAWTPKRAELSPPLYKAISGLLERDIRSGALGANVKLPPQRELADYLDVNLSTVTRAYRLCEDKGLIYASVGSGTFVSPNAASEPTVVEARETPMIDLGTIHPFYEQNRLVRDVAIEVLRRPGAESLFEYKHPLGSRSQRYAGAQWLWRMGVTAGYEQMLVTAGAQNALAIALGALFSPGMRIATDTYTYPNFVSLAASSHVQLAAAGGDENGMLPDALEALCRAGNVHGLYLMPSRNNPTNVRMPEARRREIAEIAKRYDLIVIEDDIYAFLAEGEGIPPMQALLPEQTVYISGLSKAISAGLRVGYMACPAQYQQALERGCYGVNIKTSSLNAEIAAEIIRSAAATDIIREKRKAAEERSAIYRRIFEEKEAPLATYYQWLKLPDGMAGKTSEVLCEQRGLRVFGAERFSIGAHSPANAVRISTCTPQTVGELEQGLLLLRDVVYGSGQEAGFMV